MLMTTEASGEPCITTGKISAAAAKPGGQNFHPSSHYDRGHVSRKPHSYFHRQNETPVMQYLVKYEFLISVVLMIFFFS